jgi:hypothetical protein
MGAPVVFTSPAEFIARPIAFGLLIVAGIAAIVVAGAWWASCIAAVGLLLAVAGLVASIVALLAAEQPSSWATSRSAALILGTLSAVAIVVALVAA